jgi:hypothetical protein
MNKIKPLEDYETQLRKVVAMNDDYRNGRVSRDRLEYEAKIIAHLGDNFPIFLRLEYQKALEIIRALERFEFIKEEPFFEGFGRVMGGFVTFNFKPGTVLLNCHDRYHYREQDGNPENDFEGIRRLISEEYSTRLMIHNEQGDGPKGHINPGVIMEAPDEIADAMAILDLIGMIKSQRISACFPFRFYHQPCGKYLNEVIEFR